MILILGGAKSGKTSYAENTAAAYASRNKGRVIYLASAQAWDDEMKLRIRRHQESRPAHWLTLEEPVFVPDVISKCKAEAGDALIFDCLTLWITNLLMGLGEEFKQEDAETLISDNIAALIRAAEEFSGEIYIVSNLVEHGLISPHFLGRIFQEICGKSHQTLAASSSEVYHIIAGISQRLK